MHAKKLIILTLAFLLPFLLWAQDIPTCSVRIAVVDTLTVTDSASGARGVRYHLQAPLDADSLHWWPDSLFAHPSHPDQWVTLHCGDTFRVGLTAFYNHANLFHWQQPDFLRTHTEYNYFRTPNDGDFCQPRSITLDAYPQNYCAEMDYNTSQRCIIIRPDTLWSYGDTIQPFFPLDTANPVSAFNTILPILRQLPSNPAHVPFYVDTIDMLEPDPNHTYVLHLSHFTASQITDSLYSVPILYYTVNIDDTVPRFFSEGHTVPLCDTTLFYYLNLSFPKPVGIGPSRFIVSTNYFNMKPSPRGRAIFRFYETPTPYFHTTGSYCFNRIEMAGRCTPSDSLLLTGCRCVDTLRVHDTIVQNQLPWIIHGDTLLASACDTLFLPASQDECDSLLYYALTVIPNCFDTAYLFICPNQLPYTLNGVTIHSDTIFSLTLQGSHGQDSTVTYFLHVNADSDTTLYDTILQSQLPWAFLDSLFLDTVANCPFVLTNEVGCDSIVYYNLFIFWEGDHCDSLLQFSNIVTPNGDGINDRFVIGGLVENQCYPYNLLVVADRTGRIVFKAENISRDDQFWDPAATHSPAGTYFYRFVGHNVHHATQHQGCIEILK